MGTRGENVEGEHAGNAGKIRERNQCDLRDERERDVKPRARDPSLGGVERPKSPGESGKDGAANHQNQFAIEMSVFVSENEKKFVREESRAGNDEPG